MRRNNQLSAVPDGKAEDFPAAWAPDRGHPDPAPAISPSFRASARSCSTTRPPLATFDQKGAFLHFPEGLPVHEPFGVRIQRRMKGDHIGALQKLFKIHPFIGLIRISSGSRIIDHMAAEGLGNGLLPADRWLPDRQCPRSSRPARRIFHQNEKIRDSYSRLLTLHS